MRMLFPGKDCVELNFTAQELMPATDLAFLHVVDDHHGKAECSTTLVEQWFHLRNRLSNVPLILVKGSGQPVPGFVEIPPLAALQAEVDGRCAVLVHEICQAV